MLGADLERRPHGPILQLVIAFVWITMLVLSPGCNCRGAGGGGDSIEVRDDSKGLLFTWVDQRGGFHVEQSVKDVPKDARERVRVVDPEREDGTHADRVFIADLRTAKGDGTYPVTAAPRETFENFALERRNARTAKRAYPDGGGLAQNGNQGTGDDPSGKHPQSDPDARPVVIVYGADWCSACHQAAAYLRSNKIPFVEKNVERDPAAAREMKSKLRAAGLPGGSIPVIDVRGEVMVGFNPERIQAALGTGL